MELVDFDTLYPPSPARDLMVQHFPCHGVSGWHGRRLNEVGWRRVVNRMFAKDGRVANMAVGVPQVPDTRVSEQQKEEIIKYLTATFGPGSKARDLKTDPLVRDEQALSTALYVQHELKRSVADRKFANGLAPVLGGIRARQPGEPRRRLYLGQLVEFDPARRHTRIRITTRAPKSSGSTIPAT